MIHSANANFDFSQVHLTHPVSLHGGMFYTKILHGHADNPLFLYTPRCNTRSGVMATATKQYVDLMFSNADLLDWMSKLEEHLQSAVFDKRTTWFAEDVEADDIESVFIPVLKFKENKYALRAYLQQQGKLQATPVQVYKENETPASLDELKPENDLLCIIDIQGIKYCQKSFVVLVGIKQIMIMDRTPLFSSCLIKPEARVEKATEGPVEDPAEEPVEVEVVDLPEADGDLQLKNPNEVYGEIYRSTVETARKAKEDAEKSLKFAFDLKQNYGLEV
jgi:hypothetical protein